MVLPFPGRRDLLLLAAGLLLGILLGPPVLGSVSPDAYRSLFHGQEAYLAAEAAREEAELGLEAAKNRLGLADGDANGPQGEARERAEANLQQLDQALARRVAARFAAAEAAMNNRAIGWVLGLLVALAGVFVAEVLAAPEPPRAGDARGSVVVPPAVRRLVTVRYALVAAVLTVLLARATLYEAIPWPFVGLLLAVALGAAWVPLGPNKSGPSPERPAKPPAVNPAADPPDAEPG